MEVTCGNQTALKTRRVGNMSVTLPMFDKVGVAATINRHLGFGDKEPDIDYGTTIAILLAARLYGPTPLSRIEHWASESGADLLFGVEASKLNDDRFARALDKLFTARHSVLASIALSISEQFDVPLNKLHYDPTHLFFTGRYDDSEPRSHHAVDRYDDQRRPVVRSDEDLPAVHVTKGKPLDDAPTGARMAHLGLATHVDQFGAMPMFMTAMDGNENGRTGLEEFMGVASKHLPLSDLLTISDRGTYSVAHLVRSRDQGFHATCSVPWKEVKKLFDDNFESLLWSEASFLSVEQTRRRETNSSLDQEHYETAPLLHTFTDPKSRRSVDTRVLFVYSTADAKVTAKQRAKQLSKVESELVKCQANVLRRGPFSDQASVSRRMAKLGKYSIMKHIQWEMLSLDSESQPDKAVQGRGTRIPVHEFRYSIDRQAIDNDTTYDGYSAIVTTQCDDQKSDDKIFTEFKQQAYSELANRVLKNPKQLAVRPIFVHTPERIEALSFVLTIALMFHFLIQREYRKHATKDKTLDPENSRKTKSEINSQRKMTTDRIFQVVRSYSILVEINGNHAVVRPTKPNDQMQLIIKRLNIKSPADFLRKRFC